MAVEMSNKDFAKYVIDNIGRASLVNALNITNSFTAENSSYDFVEFLKEIQVYASILCQNMRLSSDKMYKIIFISVTALENYQSDFNYNKTMLIDTFIIKLWEIFNGATSTQS